MPDVTIITIPHGELVPALQDGWELVTLLGPNAILRKSSNHPLEKGVPEVIKEHRKKRNEWSD